MKPIPGAKPPERQELGRFSDRLSFLYAERCIVHREDNAVTFTDQSGTTHAPAAMLAALVLGPGTRVSHAAMSLLGTCGVSVVWVGENGVRYYAHGRSPSGSSRMAEAQAKLVTNTRSRLRVAREMYRMRFGDEDVSSATMSQLRGFEGARMRKLYKLHSDRTGVKWSRRNYDPEDFASSDRVNTALTVGYTAMYGIAHAAIVSIGCIPALGFVHTGTDRAFTYDVADLYKADVVIPAAFDLAADDGDDVEGDMRRAVRDAIVAQKILQRMVRDIRTLLEVDEGDESAPEPQLFLWSEAGRVQARQNYSDAENVS